MPLTKYARKKLLDHSLGLASWTMPTTVYLGLFANDPTADGIMTSEPSGSGYARKDLTSRMAAADLASGRAYSDELFTFGPASGAWGALPYFGVMDASSAGNMLWYGTLTIAMTVGSGDEPPIPEASIMLELV